MEVEVLAGAARTLARTDRVVLETHGRERHRLVTAGLRDAGFDLEDSSFEGSTGLVFARRAR